MKLDLSRPPSTFFAALVLGCAAGIAEAATPLPTRELTPTEQSALSGMPAMTPSAVPFRVAATARVSAHNETTPPSQTERKSGSAAAVYAGTHGTSPALLPTWPTPGANGLLDFATEGDLAQAWATSGEGGAPYLFVTGYGAFRAEATAAWSATLTVPSGTSSREVVVRFVIPPVSVNGTTKGDAPALWRSRMRADFLVNGFPAWSTEAFRLTANPWATPNDTVVLQQFGAPLTFPNNDEDASESNDTVFGSTEGPSSKRVVFLTLGRVPEGTVLELSLSLRGTAMTVPASPNGTGNRCDKRERYFCSGATVTVRGDAREIPLFYMLP
jgi:hypothetical protein